MADEMWMCVGNDKAILEKQPLHAVMDLTQWLEIAILGRPLTPQEKGQLSAKILFWWALSATQRDALNRMNSRN